MQVEYKRWKRKALVAYWLLYLVSAAIYLSMVIVDSRNFTYHWLWIGFFSVVFSFMLAVTRQQEVHYGVE